LSPAGAAFGNSVVVASEVVASGEVAQAAGVAQSVAAAAAAKLLQRMEQTFGGDDSGHGDILTHEEVNELENAFKAIAGEDVEINIKHIFSRDANKYGKPTGFHHFLEGDDAPIKIMRKGPQGTFLAKWFNSAGNKTSSFFSCKESRMEVIKMIAEAYKNPVEGSCELLKFVGKSKKGLEIEFLLAPSKDVVSAYPCVKYWKNI